jgi:hypothetical protein
MAEVLGPATELDAVNEMLRSIGQSPVNSIVTNVPPDAVIALAALRAASRDIQEEGWHFNTETDVELAFDVGDGHIDIPTNALKVDAVDSSTNITVRGAELYDLDDNTLVFTKNVKCQIIYHFQFSDLPAVARRYFTQAAIFERFAPAYDVSDAMTRINERNFVRARSAFLDAEMENGDYNLLSSIGASNVIRRTI